MRSEIAAKELWYNISRIFATNNNIAGQRTTKYQELMRVIYPDESIKLTLIDDPYHALKGIGIFLNLTDKVRVRTRGVSLSDVKHQWKAVFGDIPNEFADYQVQLVSLWIYAYYNIQVDRKTEYKSNKMLDSTRLYNTLVKLYEFYSNWFMAMDRSLIYVYYNEQISLEELVEKDRRFKLSTYESLSGVHDFLSTCNLVTTVAPSVQRRFHFLSKEVVSRGRAKWMPGRAYDVMITIPGIYVLKKIDNLAKTEQGEVYRDPNEIYKGLQTLKKYYNEMYRIAEEKINDSLSNYSQSGVSIVDVDNYKNYLPAEVVNAVEEPLQQTVVLRHELASMILWLATVKQFKVDFASFTRGLLKLSR